MTLANLDQVLTHYILSTHPLNGSITDLTNKNTGELAYIKIRHKVANMYAISLVDPKTFVAYAETHCKSATSRSRNIVLHCGDEQHKDDKEVTLRETSIFGFEWCFEWAGEQYRWIRESRLSGSLECRRKTGSSDVCVAQYMPRGIKNEYFGVLSVPVYSMSGLDDRQRRGLELVLCISLLTMLDKSDESSWIMKRNSVNNNSSSDTQIEPSELPTPSNSKKDEQKRMKIERELQLMLERDIRRSQKQILHEDSTNNNYHYKKASSSKNNSPQVSPIPTPTTSTKTSTTKTTLTRQKSASVLRDRLANSSLANMKHLDATATLQLPAAAANNTMAPLESLFSSLPPQQQSQQQVNPPVSAPATNKSPSSAPHSASTSPATTPTAYYPSNPLPYFHYYAQSSSASSGAAKSSSNGNVVQSQSKTSVRWDHHTQQQQQLQQQQPNNVSKRPTAQRRVSTGDQILHHYPMRMYAQMHHHHQQQQHHHHHQQQQHQQHIQQQQRYVPDYYNYMYQ